MKLFECKIRYDKMLEKGLIKKVTEIYLVEALSFTEAEARIIEEMSPFISGGFSIANITPTNIAEIGFDNQDGRYYICKVNFIALDEKAGTEKKTAVYMLILADSVENAGENLKVLMKGTLADWESESVRETKIMDVFLYGNKDDEKA